MSAPYSKGTLEPTNLAILLEGPAGLTKIDTTQIPALMTQLSAMQISLAAALVKSQEESRNNPDDTVLSVSEAAERLGVSKDWLYRRTKTLPFVVRIGRHVKFSLKGIDRYIRSRIGR